MNEIGTIIISIILAFEIAFILVVIIDYFIEPRLRNVKR